MAVTARSDIVLNGIRFEVYRPTGVGRSLRGTDQPKVATEAFTDQDIPLVLDTWHLGAGYSQRLLPGTYSYAVNGDGRMPRVFMPGPEINLVTLTNATDYARWAVDIGNDTHFGGGRYVYIATNGSATSPLAAQADWGAGSVGWSAIDWGTDKALIGTDVGGVAGTLWKYTVGAGWTSGTAKRRALAAAYYNTTNGFRLFGTTDTAGNNTIKTIPEDDGTAGRDPLTDANWGTSITVGAYGNIKLNKLVANQDHVYVATHQGLFDFDGATGKSFNLTPQQSFRRNADNGVAAAVGNGYVFYGHKHGLLAYQGVGLDAGRQYDVSFGYGLPNETPIRGQVTAVAQDRGWTVQAIWNGADTYICWGRFLGNSDTSIGSSPMLWHGGLIKLSAQKCYLLFISGQTDPPKLWFGSGANVAWCYLPRTDNPLQDADYRFATTYSVVMPAEDWGRPSTRKNLLELEVEGENLGIGAFLTWRYRVDGMPQAVLGTANNSPISLLLPNTEIIGRRLELQADGSNTNTAGANIRSLVLRAAERVSVRAIREYDVYLSEWGRDSYGGIDTTRVLRRIEDLRNLISAGVVSLRDEFDQRLTVLVLAPVTWREIYGSAEGAKTTTGPSIVATVRLKILRAPGTGFSWDDGTKWDAGKQFA